MQTPAGGLLTLLVGNLSFLAASEILVTSGDLSQIGATEAR